MNAFIVSIRSLFFFTILLGGIYTVLMTFVGKIFYNEKNYENLIGQEFTKPIYFLSRPSAVGYYAEGSGATNLSLTSKTLVEQVKLRKATIGELAPADLIYSSASGLDPHISPESAYFQVPKIAAARQLSEEKIKNLIAGETMGYSFGFLGRPRINVLKLNQKMDLLK